ncbi:MAG: Cof-type HAD-IIB family hydrolase [Peptococcaceae bacterium]|nr:Cof-type HAD-IIB family hydrolase [Peptococcaceae bacterium]
MTEYKMLATDLDDSLLDDNFMIAPVDREAIAGAVRAGVRVVLATGRMYRSALPYARELGLDTPLITYQGAYVRFPGSEKVLYSRPVPWDLALELLEMIAPTGYHTNIYIDDDLLVEKVTEAGRLYWAISRVKPVEVGDLAAYLRRVRRDPAKVLVVSGEENLDRLSEELNGVFAGRLHITKSKPYFLEFMHPEANKARALDAVARHYGIGRENIIAVGDSYNDLEMIEYAGLGVAVANARDDVKARADFVTRSNTEGGVAGVIRKFIFKEED